MYNIGILLIVIIFACTMIALCLCKGSINWHTAQYDYELEEIIERNRSKIDK